MSSKGKDKRSIKISDSRGIVIGDFAHVVNNFIEGIDEKIFKRFGIEQRLGFIFTSVLIVASGILLWLALRPAQPETMSGDFRIAVAGFAEIGDGIQRGLGYELADGVKLRLERDLQEIDPGLIITVWGPDKIKNIEGQTAQIRAEAAEELAQRIHADMVIYGVVVSSSERDIKVLPEFFISAENFYEASEITGQHEFGAPIFLSGSSNPVLRYEFGKQIYTRGKALAVISVGLAYFAIRDYSTALDILQTAEQVDDWEDEQSKKVLYVLIGLVAGKAGKYDLAEEAISHAITIAPDYARPYIGMANLSYMRALAPFEQSKDPDHIDLDSLESCFAYLDMAANAPEKPPLADVDAKIHFSRGQCYLLKTYSGQLSTFDLAKGEFEQVIDAYGNGTNARLRELAGEAYARLGLIYNLLGDLPEAVDYYQTAAELLPAGSERRALYNQRVEGLLSQMTPTP